MNNISGGLMSATNVYLTANPHTNKKNLADSSLRVLIKTFINLK